MTVPTEARNAAAPRVAQAGRKRDHVGVVDRDASHDIRAGQPLAEIVATLVEWSTGDVTGQPFEPLGSVEVPHVDGGRIVLVAYHVPDWAGCGAPA